MYMSLLCVELVFALNSEFHSFYRNGSIWSKCSGEQTSWSHSYDKNIFLTGGWNKIVQFWDSRDRLPIRSVAASVSFFASLSVITDMFRDISAIRSHFWQILTNSNSVGFLRHVSTCYTPYTGWIFFEFCWFPPTCLNLLDSWPVGSVYVSSDRRACSV